MHLEPINVLLVEDNPGDIYLTSEALKFGMCQKHIYIATDGEEALDFLFQKGKFEDAPRPDLILLDLKLPKLDGHEVLGAVKRDENLKQIPVVVLSTSNSESDVVTAYERHANCYLTKPSDLDEFLDLVQAVEQYWLRCVSLPAA